MAFINSELTNEAGSLSVFTGANRFSRHLFNRRSLYLFLAALMFCWNSIILWETRQSLDLQTYSLLLWLGILISLEDQLPHLWPKPSPASFFAGALILAFLLSLTPWIINEYLGIPKYLLLPVIVFALGLLSRPVGKLQLFKNPLLISLLLTLSGIVRLLFGSFLTKITALLSWTFLYGIGFQAALSGQQIMLSSGGVLVGNGCNGVEQLIFSVSMVVIFQLIFPLKSRSNILKALLGAILSGVVFNVLRIGLLAYLTTWPNKSGMPAFNFWHVGLGGLLISLVAAAIAGWIYLTLLDRELAA